MSFKSIAQFKSGNFNSWYDFSKNVMPKAFNDIRKILIPTLDEILDSMLGMNADGQKESVDLIPQIDKDGSLNGMSMKICYTVDDFKVSEAPEDAVSQDTDAIRNVLSQKGFKVTDLKIDTESGNMTVELIFNMHPEENA